MIEDHQGADMSGRDDLFSNFLKANNEDLSDVKLDLQELIANTYMFLVAGIEVGWFPPRTFFNLSLPSR
jgi:cytochrome P450